MSCVFFLMIYFGLLSFEFKKFLQQIKRETKRITNNFNRNIVLNLRRHFISLNGLRLFVLYS
jgi:hypothetical protein